ncbi:fumarylacetoacetate hydrolase [Xylariaceae sp. FL0255]|nr:fumarylacetoacetate hydrolase [Xylariaceae sp. FL0255]
MGSTPGSPFTLKNLPYGIITSRDNGKKRCATVLEDHAIDLSVLHKEGLFTKIPGLEEDLFANEYLNAFSSLPKEARGKVREVLLRHLSTPGSSSSPAFVPLAEVQNHFPMDTRNFSDFYCSLEHTRNCTAVFKPDSEPGLNWFTAPMVYNGRTSSLTISGTPVRRPCGIFSPLSSKEAPSFQPELSMDFELEMGVFLTGPTPRGTRLAIEDARDSIFGFVLLNDWSARQIQGFEMPPLGPFHSKGTATSISPWIVTTEALEAVACKMEYPQHSEPLQHLRWVEDSRATYDIELSAKIIRGGQSYLMCQSNLNELYWTPFQQVTHLASAGEGLSAGDVFGTGTVSSPRKNSQGEKVGLGCIFERMLPTNTLSSLSDISSTFLKDGDRVVFDGWCRDPITKEVLFGFGTCEGELLPALPL